MTTYASAPPEPDWYLDNVLVHARPGHSRLDVGPVACWQDWWRSRTVAVPGADGRGFVCNPAQLRDAGVSRSTARWAVRSGHWAAAAVGAVGVVDVRHDDPFVAARRTHALAAAGAALRDRDLVISGRSAAVLHGLPTLHVPEQVEATDRAPQRTGRRTTVHRYDAGISAAATTGWFGVPVTTVARTLVDLARHDRRDAIMAVDAARREQLITGPEIGAALCAARGWPGVRQARAVLRLADPAAESPLESLVRLAAHDEGFPPPLLQYRIDGFRVDLCWPQCRLVVEVDGLGKYSDAEWRREKRREQRLRAAGYLIERVTWDDVLRHWPETAARLHRAMSNRRSHPRPSCPGWLRSRARSRPLRAGRRKTRSPGKHSGPADQPTDQRTDRPTD